MRHYIGTKTVKAEPAINDDTMADGYRVLYPDGYESWSPKDVFEEAYIALPRDPQQLKRQYPVLGNYFEFSHLPPYLQDVSKHFWYLAWIMVSNDPDNPAEVAAGLRKLLEAKDCFVRAAIK